MSTAPAISDNEVGSSLETAQSEKTTDGISQVVSFRLANEEYGLDIMHVQEIILMGDITEIPEVPDYVCGLINLRGRVIPILDLRKRFHLEAGMTTEHTRIIVLNTSGSTYGIVVDSVNEVLRIQPDQVETPPKGVTGMDSAYIKGLLKLEECIMILLDINKIMTREDEMAISKNNGSNGMKTVAP